MCPSSSPKIADLSEGERLLEKKQEVAESFTYLETYK